MKISLRDEHHKLKKEITHKKLQTTILYKRRKEIENL